MRIAAIVRFPANLPTYGSPYGEGDENTDNLRTIRSFADTMMHRTGSRPARSRSQCDPRPDRKSSSMLQHRWTPAARIGRNSPTGFPPSSTVALRLFASMPCPALATTANHCCLACFICSRTAAILFVDGLSDPYKVSRIFSACLV